MLKAVHTPKSELTNSVPPPKVSTPTAMAVGSFFHQLTMRVEFAIRGGAFRSTTREP